MVTATFENSKTLAVVTDEVWQYDYGQTLRIEGLDLDLVTEIDFSFMEKGGVALSVAGVGTSDGAMEVSIPDIMLKGKRRIRDADYVVYAFVYESGDESGETTHWIKIPVRARPARKDYDGSETEEDPFADAIAAVNEAAETATTASESAQAVAEELSSSLEQISTNTENISSLQADLSSLQETAFSLYESLQELAESLQEDVDNLLSATARISQNESDIKAINSSISEIKETLEALGLSVVDGAISTTYTES